jgi:integrase
MQAKPAAKDQWLTQPFKRGAGVFVGRITPRGERLFYFRYTDSAGKRPFLPIGPYHPKGKDGLTLADAYAKACELSELYRSGIKDLHAHLERQQRDQRLEDERLRREAEEADRQAALEAQRRVTVRQLFEKWASVELRPHTRSDGQRVGRKDGGAYIRDQFERRLFPTLGDIAAQDVRKSDLLAILDSVRAEGKLRTCNVLLASMKQMLRFAVAREIIPFNPLESVTKRDAGGTDVERDRVLSAEEICSLSEKLPNANMSSHSMHAVWLILATGCRVGELMGARWEDIDLDARKWHLPETKNQRPHTIHLSSFALHHFQALADLRIVDDQGQIVPWVFPNTKRDGPVCIKSFGKQLADRQRPADKRLSGRTKETDSLSLTGGRWTAHDLRRTAATTMAQLGISNDVIDECLNHKLQSRMSRIYIRDRREAEQAVAFDALGKRLSSLFDGISGASNVIAMRSRRA